MTVFLFGNRNFCYFCILICTVIFSCNSFIIRIFKLDTNLFTVFFGNNFCNSVITIPISYFFVFLFNRTSVRINSFGVMIFFVGYNFCTVFFCGFDRTVFTSNGNRTVFPILCSNSLRTVKNRLLR